MAQRNSPGGKAAPRLVVKIVGGNQVRRFVEEPEVHTRDTARGEDPLVEASIYDFQRPSEKLDVSHRVEPALWAAITQVPDRLCVTAPSGDRSWSFIHPKTLGTTDPSAAALETPKPVLLRGACEEPDELAAAIGGELSGGQLSCLTSAESEMASIDGTVRGTLSRSEITHLFLKNNVPLKLPTFSLLLQMFSDKTDPDQVHYRELLQFLRSSASTEERWP